MTRMIYLLIPLSEDEPEFSHEVVLERAIFGVKRFYCLPEPLYERELPLHPTLRAVESSSPTRASARLVDTADGSHYAVISINGAYLKPLMEFVRRHEPLDAEPRQRVQTLLSALEVWTPLNEILPPDADETTLREIEQFAYHYDAWLLGLSCSCEIVLRFPP